jgi:prepilin-type N-terminal cleavage/methylation domain-containing protein
MNYQNIKNLFLTISQKKSGFTLIELLVYMAIFGMVGTMGYEFIIQGFRDTTFSSEQEEAVDNARRAEEVLSKEIRGANNSDNGYYPLATTTDQELVFYADINDDNSMEKIRYYINGTSLMKSLTMSGATHNYSSTPTVTKIADYLNNGTEPLFIYYDRNNAETDIINNIRMIGISVKINVTPTRAPNDYYVITNVHLRNLKDNL